MAIGFASPAILSGLGCSSEPESVASKTSTQQEDNPKVDINNKAAMKIHYLEIVTSDLDATCNLYSKMYGVTWSDPDPSLGGAKTAKLADGGLFGIRNPMHDAEKPVVRPYILVENIEEAVKSVGDDAVIAVPPMEIPGHGTCAIVIQNELELGLWQLAKESK